MFGIPIDLLLLALAVLLDLALGELPSRLHPTVWMGKTITLAEKLAPRGQTLQLIYGGLMAVLIPGLWGVAAYMGAQGLQNIHDVAYILLGAVLLKSTFAIKMLHRAAAQVRTWLIKKDLAQVRASMSSLVSRDPSTLTQEQATAAAVESVSENITDSFLAPLIAFALFGLPGAVIYRAINTLDSMIGYHGRYEFLGKASARLDDLINLVPARLAALLLVLGSVVVPGQGPFSAWRIMWRDHRRTESPNAGWTMSGMAGALGVVLEKSGHYRLGDDTRPLEPQDISRAIQIMYLVATLGLLIAVGIIVLKNGFL
ncbi:MAG TPA: adenosylcobinamide-phosphate synthase CbiB [Dehalococcoidia bacterium]|nr:adenosylcobinamide-phosphate synthase CbiB [Dehalococcoidia bacterium]